MQDISHAPNMLIPRFNEAAGADPADAHTSLNSLAMFCWLQ